MDADSKAYLYEETLKNIEALTEDETDTVAIMATVICELHYAFSYFDWTGFYRVTEPGLLKIGPYQGDHGCLRISFDRGVCGAAARTGETQLVSDVHQFPGHIACNSSTQSEIVIPVFSPSENVVAVLDIDSDESDAFDETDQHYLESLCDNISRVFG